MKKNFNKKLNGCKYLVSLKTKKINKTHIIAASIKVGLKGWQMEQAWNNFQESGGKQVDRSCWMSKVKFPDVNKTHKCIVTRERAVTPSEAATIILQYMEERNTTSRMLCNEHEIKLTQFYDWLHELNVSGTLLGVKVLNPKKYAKLSVKDAVWLAKCPKTKRKTIKDLTATERLAYERFIDVLRIYLKSMAKPASTTGV